LFLRVFCDICALRETACSDAIESSLVVLYFARGYDKFMHLIRIRFADRDSKRRALGFLAGRFSFTSYSSGEMLVVEPALAALAVEGISFTAEGPATYAEAIPSFRAAAAEQVQ
jgi:hypothetical protein